MADPVDTTRAADSEVERVRVAAVEEQPTVITDDPDVTGAPEGEEVVTSTAAPDTPSTTVESADSEQVDAGTVVSRLEDLTRRELERLLTAVEGVLRSKGTEPGKDGPTLSEIASRLPVNEATTAAISAEQVAGAFDGVEVSDLLTWKVRQKQDIEGNPTGPAYLRIVTRDGQKLTATHG